MAVSLLSHEVSDLCIGKPPLKSLPTSATVGEAILALKLCGDSFVSIIADGKRPNPSSSTIAGKLCMVDILSYLCSDSHISSPSSALKTPISSLLPKHAPSLIPLVSPNSSILEALDVILEGGAQTLVVPIRSSSFCWLTQEDLVRFFLNNIFLFSSVAPLSVTDLGLVRPAVLSLRRHDSAISALPLIAAALKDNTSVAVVTDDGKLIGEISPSTLSSCDETVAAAIASLSAGDLMAYIDCCSCGSAPESVVQGVKERLKDKGMKGMLDLLEGEDLSMPRSVSLSSSSSSSDEEAEVVAKKRRPRRMRSGSYSSRMGRRSEEAIVCHPESSLVAVMVQALAHRVSYVWVVDEEDYGLVGIVAFEDILKVFRELVQ